MRGNFVGSRLNGVFWLLKISRALAKVSGGLSRLTSTVLACVARRAKNTLLTLSPWMFFCHVHVLMPTTRPPLLTSGPP